MNDHPKDPDTESEPEEEESISEEDTPMDSATIARYKQGFQDLLVQEGITELQGYPVPDKEAAALERQKHIASGWAIYERTTKGVHKTKTEAHELMVTVNKFFRQGSLSTFVVQDIDINLEGEAKGTRLEAGTNHKRARSMSSQYLNFHNRLLELPTSEEHDTSRAVRSRSEEIDTEACERGRRLQRAGNTKAWTEEGHAGDDMSERSSGTRRQTRSSLALTSEGSADRSGGADTSPTLGEEIAEPAGKVEVEVGFPIFPRAEVGEAVVESSARLYMVSNTTNITSSQSIYIRGSSRRIRPEDVQKELDKERIRLGTLDLQK